MDNNDKCLTLPIHCSSKPAFRDHCRVLGKSVPHYNALLTVPVNDAFGEEAYQCCECNGQFVANWADETVTPTVNLSLNISVDYEEPEDEAGS